MIKVDEAVAKALTDLNPHLTGEREIDEFMEQSIITLGGLVKMAAMTNKLDIKDEKKLMFDAILKTYRMMVDSVAYDICGMEEDG